MNWDHKELKATVKTSEILPFLGCQTRLVVPGAGAYLECLSEDHRSWGNVVMPLCSFSSMDLLCFIYFLLLRMHTFMLICQLIGVPKCVLSGTLTVFVVLAAKCSQKVYFVFISCALLYTCLPPSLPQIWNEVMCIVGWSARWLFLSSRAVTSSFHCRWLEWLWHLGQIYEPQELQDHRIEKARISYSECGGKLSNRQTLSNKQAFL